MTVIDEDWLAQTLHELGSAIEVPEDGPQRVLVARGPLPRPIRSRRSPGGEPAPGSDPAPPSRRRQLVAVGVAVGAVAALVMGVVLVRSATHRSTPVMTGLPLAPVPSNALAPLTTVAGAAQAAPAASVPGVPATSVPGVPGGPSSAPAVATKVIKTGTVDLQVAKGRVSPTVDQLTSLAGGLGGYVSDATTDEVGATPSADMTLRVPADQFETLLTRTRALGTPTVVTTSGQDVTANYVDLNAQIEALEATRTQYLQILAKATTIGDILSVEQQISDLQTQLQQLQGQQMVLADQTSYGTLTVHVSVAGSSPVGPPPTSSGLEGAWQHARSSFAHGIEAVIGASGGVLVFLAFAGLVLLAGRLVWPVVRRWLV